MSHQDNVLLLYDMEAGTVFNRLASVGVTLPNAALVVHGLVITRAMDKAMPLAHLSHPSDLSLISKEYGPVAALSGDMLDEARS